MADKSTILEEDLLVRVCKMYYIENMTQAEVAKAIGVSRSQVSKLLSKARKLGIVKIRIKPQFIWGESKLQERLKKKYKLKNVVIAKESVADGIASVAVVAAKFLSDYLGDGQIVGLSWGRTLARTIDSIATTKNLSNTVFLPLIGGINQTGYTYQMNTLVEKMANIFSAIRYYLYAPAHFDSIETLNMMLKEKAISSVVKLWSNVDIALVGIGEPITLSTLLKESFDPIFLAELLKEKVVGDVLTRFFKNDGTPCKIKDYDDHILGMTLEELKKVPEVIGIAGGMEKADAIYGAIRGGYINSLITDISVAEYLLEKDGKSENRGSL